MNTETFQEIAYGRISDMVDQMHYHQSKGDRIMVALLNTEIRDLTDSLDNEDDFFYAPDFSYL
jgi:hypothetical protein